VILVFLTFLPALALGPLAEGLHWQGRRAVLGPHSAAGGS
jgi:hypothetical protein